MFFHQCRVGKNFADGPGGVDLTAVQHEDPITEIDSEVEVVRRDNLAARKLSENFDQSSPRSRVEIRKRFVENQNVRMAGEHSRKADALALTETQLQRAAVLVLSQPDTCQAVRDSRKYFLPTEPQIQRTKRNVFPHRRTEELIVGILKHKSDPLPNRLNVLSPERLPGDCDEC